MSTARGKLRDTCSTRRLREAWAYWDAGQCPRPTQLSPGRVNVGTLRSRAQLPWQNARGGREQLSRRTRTRKRGHAERPAKWIVCCGCLYSRSQTSGRVQSIPLNDDRPAIYGSSTSVHAGKRQPLSAYFANQPIHSLVTAERLCCQYVSSSRCWVFIFSGAVAIVPRYSAPIIALAAG
jgi:hypothetical protein